MPRRFGTAATDPVDIVPPVPKGLNRTLPDNAAPGAGRGLC